MQIRSASDAGIRSFRSRDFSVMNSIEEDDNYLGDQPYVASSQSAQLAPSTLSAPTLTYNQASNAGSDNVHTFSYSCKVYSSTHIQITHFKNLSLGDQCLID